MQRFIKLFTGPTAVALGDAIMSARILSKFAKDNENQN